MMLPKPECTANAAFQKLYVDVVVRWWSCVFKKKKKTERRDYWYYCVITVCKESKYKEQMMCCNYLLLLNMPCMQSIIQSCFCKIASCCTTQRNEEKKADGWMDYGQPHKQLQLPTTTSFFSYSSSHILFTIPFFIDSFLLPIVCFARWKHQVSFSQMKNGKGRGWR